MAGDIYDLYIGRNELSGVPEFVRLQVDEEFEAIDGRVRMRFTAIGGGKTNIPRWQSFPRLTFDRDVVFSMRRSGQLEPVCPTASEVSMTS